MVELDREIGASGLHDVGRSARPRVRKTIPPPDIFDGHDAGAFRNKLEEEPDGLRVV